MKGQIFLSKQKDGEQGERYGFEAITVDMEWNSHFISQRHHFCGFNIITVNREAQSLLQLRLKKKRLLR
jgi:hypothetical protein